MAEILAKLKRLTNATEAGLIAALIPYQWGLAEDTKRLVASDSAGNKLYFWDSSRLALTTASNSGADKIGVSAVSGINGGAAGTVQQMFSALTGQALTLAGPVTVSSTLGVGGAAATDIGLRLANTALTSANPSALNVDPTFPATATSSITGGYLRLKTAAASFNVPNAYGLLLQTPSLGAGSTVGTLVGLYIGSHTAGTTNWAIYTNSGKVRFGDDLVLSTMTAGSVLFAGASGQVSQDNTALSWDNTTKTLSIRRDQNTTSFLGNFQNANTSTAASTQLNIGQDGSTGKNLALNYLGSGYTTSGTNIASSALIRAENGATGGLVIRTDANAPLIFSTNGLASDKVRLRIEGDGRATFWVPDQTTGALSTSTGGLNVTSRGASMGSGGAVFFSADQGSFAAIKGYLQDGTANTRGALVFCTRVNTLDATLTPHWTLNSDGKLSGAGGGYIWSADTNEIIVAGPTGVKFIDSGDASVFGILNATGLNIGNTRLSGSGISTDGGTDFFTFDRGSFTVTLDGVTTTVTGTAYWERNGKQVHLRLPALSGTSNSTTCALTGIPAGLVPAYDTVMPAYVWDNGVIKPGRVSWQAGATTIYFAHFTSSVFETNFTSSGTKGVHTLTEITYLIA